MSKYIRYIAYILEILLLYVIEQTPFFLETFIGAKPIIIISSAVSIAMLERQSAGIFFGVLSGVLIDVGLSGCFGLHTAIMTVICFFAGKLTTELIKTNILTVTLTVAASCIVLFSLQFLFLYVFKGYADIGYALVRHFLPVMLLSIIPAPVTYLLNKLIFVCFRERQG